MNRAAFIAAIVAITDSTLRPRGVVDPPAGDVAGVGSAQQGTTPVGARGSGSLGTSRPRTATQPATKEQQ